MEEMMRFIGESVWFFLPAFVGNQFPGFAVWVMTRCNCLHWNIPVSERWLGKNKTWQAYPSAILGATVTIYLQRGWYDNDFIEYSSGDLWLVGVLFGIGIVTGDNVKSFFKRQFKKIPPGESWRPYDQLDFVAGGLFAVSFILGWRVWVTAMALIPVVLLLNPIVNGVGYQLGLRKVPY